MQVAVVLGASGAVGRHLVKELIDSKAYQTIYLVVRRSLSDDLWQYVSAELQIHQLLVDDFSNMRKALSVVNMVDADVYVTLGTTIRQAGSKSVFYQVDHDYVVHFATLCRASHAKGLYVLTSMGANPASSTFYLRVKGKLEQSLMFLNYPVTRFFRPSILLGRPNDGRVLENFSAKMFNLMGKYVVPATISMRPIEVERVAQAMVQTALNAKLQGVLGAAVLNNKAMLEMTLSQ